MFLGSFAISWSSKKQRTIACSFIKIEYHAIANAIVEVKWFIHLLKELHIEMAWALIVYCDNLGATYLTKNPIFHSQVKHVAIDFHFVWDQV